MPRANISQGDVDVTLNAHQERSVVSVEEMK
jgi:hypothetical protein